MSLEPEHVAMVKPKPRVITGASIVQQLSFFEKTKILPYWPAWNSLEETIGGFMERLGEVRAINKKYLQKKAFYDLLSFMKGEGLRPNF